MEKYVSPMVLENEELAEGVYMASGDESGGDVTTDCWTGNVYSTQDWNGAGKVFRINLTHGSGQHISGETVTTVEFSQPVTVISCEYAATANGNQVTITRGSHGNAYGSGDNADFSLVVWAVDQPTTQSLTASLRQIQCRHETNVQGNLD